MHKKIKHIIAITLVIGAISGVLPASNFMIGTEKVFASTYRSASDGELNSLTIKRSTGSEVQLKETYGGTAKSLSGDKDYYIDLTGADGFYISASVEGDGVVKVFSSADKTAEGKDIGDYVDIDSTYEDIYLRTYKSEDAYKEAYGDDDVTDCEDTYVIHVKKPDSDDLTSDDEIDKDYAYLESIYLSTGTINFSQQQYSYSVNVSDSTQELLIRATPQNSDDAVEIGGTSVEESDNFERTVSLSKGTNTIKIDVKSDDDEETYTLTVYRGTTAATATTSTTTTTSSTTDQNSTVIDTTDAFNNAKDNVGKYNSWQKVNGKMEYIDSSGQVLKDKWKFDNDTGKSYYLKSDGTMATGWISNSNNWYYFNEKGEMQKGWINLGNSWYYLGESGIMQKGWLEDSSGNWYYLDSNGTMKTGWLENSDGSWYYFDTTGKLENTQA